MDTRPRFRLDRSRPAAVQVLERLRDDIISLAMPPGTVIARLTLAEQFGLSSTPVRDALLKLEEEGLVDIFPQHATVVSAIDLSLAYQAQFLRRSIEMEIVRTLAEKHDAAVADRLATLVGRQRAAQGRGDMDEFTILDAAFHRQLYEEMGVGDLWALVRRQSGHLDRLRALHLPISGKAKAILDEHDAIVAAIRSGEGAAAQERLRAHLSGTLANIEVKGHENGNG